MNSSRHFTLSISLPILTALALAIFISTLAPSTSAQVLPASGGTNVSSEPCGWDHQCSKDSPCCSEFGYCSSGMGCLNGCNPLGSASNEYCAPVPVCQSTNYTFPDDSRIEHNLTAFDGDTSKWDWTIDKLDSDSNPVVQNNELVLTLTEAGGGTRLSSTRAVLYGNITASIKTVGAVGVVTAFITMSGVKDEIDWEWTTSNTSEAQNNYYWMGDVDNYSHGGKALARNRASDYVVYGFTWTPDYLSWTVEGKTVRTLQRDDTLDKTSGLYKFPQTPSRVQFSVWPAGLEGASQGTIDWSGGLIDYTASDYTATNSFQAFVQWVNIDCDDSYAQSLSWEKYSNSSSSNSTSSSNNSTKRGLSDEGGEWSGTELVKRADEVNSYIWGVNNTAGQIQLTSSDAPTVINSPYSTGMNMLVKDNDTKGVKATSSDGTSSDSAAVKAVKGWWSNLNTPAKVGIIIGIVAVTLFLLVAVCTCCARRNDRKKQKAYAAVKDPQQAIPLNKLSAGAGAAAGAGRRPTQLQPQGSSVSLASSTGKHSYSGYGREDVDSPRYAPPYAQQQYPQQHQHQHQQQWNQQQPRSYSPAPSYGYDGNYAAPSPTRGQWAPQGGGGGGAYHQQEYSGGGYSGGGYGGRY